MQFVFVCQLCRCDRGRPVVCLHRKPNKKTLKIVKIISIRFVGRRHPAFHLFLSSCRCCSMRDTPYLPTRYAVRCSQRNDAPIWYANVWTVICLHLFSSDSWMLAVCFHIVSVNAFFSRRFFPRSAIGSICCLIDRQSRATRTFNIICLHLALFIFCLLTDSERNIRVRQMTKCVFFCDFFFVGAAAVCCASFFVLIIRSAVVDEWQISGFMNLCICLKCNSHQMNSVL